MMTPSTCDQVLKMTKRLRYADQLQLLETLSRTIREQLIEVRLQSILELKGLGADIWQGVDVQAYLD